MSAWGLAYIIGLGVYSFAAVHVISTNAIYRKLQWQVLATIFALVWPTSTVVALWLIANGYDEDEKR